MKSNAYNQKVDKIGGARTNVCVGTTIHTLINSKAKVAASRGIN